MHSWSLAWPDLVGFLGVALLIGTYGALQIGKLSADNPAYSAANAVAALLIAFSLFFSFNAASMVIEVFWFAISVYGFVRAVRGKRSKSEGQKAGITPPS